MQWMNLKMQPGGAFQATAVLAALLLLAAPCFATVASMCCGDNFCCGLTPSRGIRCWGGHNFTEPTGQFMGISCAGRGGVAIGFDRTVTACFGEAGYGVESCVTGITGAAVNDLANSYWGGCAIHTVSGYLTCWGPTFVYGVDSRPGYWECVAMYGAANCALAQTVHMVRGARV
jgi:hypothetical protein